MLDRQTAMANYKIGNKGLSGGEKFIIYIYLFVTLFVFHGLELVAKLLFG